MLASNLMLASVTDMRKCTCMHAKLLVDQVHAGTSTKRNAELSPKLRCTAIISLQASEGEVV